MRISNFTVNNILKIESIDLDLTAAGNSIFVGGKNNQGKTSFLNAFEMALRGKSAFPETPVKVGAEKGTITFETTTGFRVERTIKPDGKHTLKITDKEGATPKSPQALLDSFYNAHTVDPLHLVSLKDKKVRKDLFCKAVGIDVDKINDKKRTISEKRRADGATLNSITSQLAALPPLDNSLPVSPIDTAQLSSALQASLEERHNRRNAEAQKAIWLEEIEQLKEEIKEKEALLTDVNKFLSSPLNHKEPEAIEEELGKLTTTNYNIYNNIKRTELEIQKRDYEAMVSQGTERLKKIDEATIALIASKKLPVEGLTVTDDDILVNGLSWEQLSMSLRIRVSVAVALALESQIKLLLVRDGSSLDEENRALLTELANKHDCLMIIEVVGKEGAQIVIENGRQLHE